MADNDDVRRQIAQLTDAIRQRKQQQSASQRFAAGRGRGRATTQNLTWSLERQGGAKTEPNASAASAVAASRTPTFFGSRNLKLINVASAAPPEATEAPQSAEASASNVAVKIESGSSSETIKAEPPAQPVSYVRVNNKLVRVGTNSQSSTDFNISQSRKRSASDPASSSTSNLTSSSSSSTNPSKKRQKIQAKNKKLIVRDGVAYTVRGSSLVAVNHAQATSSKDLSRSANHASQIAAAKLRAAKRSGANKSLHRVVINGIEFIADVSRMKLVRVGVNEPSGSAPASPDRRQIPNGIETKTPKRVLVNGQKFVRSKSGNLILASKAKKPSARAGSSSDAHLQTASGKQRRPKKTAAEKKARKRGRSQFCQFYRYGRCNKGTKCRFKHDPTHIALCPTFMQTGTCANPSTCTLSHTPREQTTPFCIHFERGLCTRDPCRYLHVKLSPDAQVCMDFARDGYCRLGSRCNKQHVVLCPDYELSGSCPRGKNCRMPHREKLVKEAHEVGPSSSSIASPLEDDMQMDIHAVAASASLSRYDASVENGDDGEGFALPPRPDFSKIIFGNDQQDDESSDEESVQDEEESVQDDDEIEEEEVESEIDDDDGSDSEELSASDLSFQVDDENGFSIQVELPSWIDHEPDPDLALIKEEQQESVKQETENEIQEIKQETKVEIQETAEEDSDVKIKPEPV